MKNLSLLLSILALFLFFSCEKDEPVNPASPGDGTEEPVPEDTLILKPFKYGIPGEPQYGFVQAVWQDSFLWEAAGVAQDQNSHSTNPEDYITIQFGTAEPSIDSAFWFLRQNLFFSEIPKGQQGTYTVSGGPRDYNDGMVGARFYTSTDDGDVGEDSYIVDETATDNQLAIIAVDTAERIYMGTFTVSFEISTEGGKRNPDNPDHFTIRDAEFWVRIIQ